MIAGTGKGPPGDELTRALVLLWSFCAWMISPRMLVQMLGTNFIDVVQGRYPHSWWHVEPSSASSAFPTKTGRPHRMSSNGKDWLEVVRSGHLFRATRLTSRMLWFRPSVHAHGARIRRSRALDGNVSAQQHVLLLHEPALLPFHVIWR